MKSGAGAGTGGLGGVPSYALPAKRRWRGLVIGVLGLVILSMLVPLVFLLGLHNAGYIYEQKNSPSNGNGLERYEVGDQQNRSEGEQSIHVQELMTKFEPTLPKVTFKTQGSLYLGCHSAFQASHRWLPESFDRSQEEVWWILRWQ